MARRGNSNKSNNTTTTPEEENVTTVTEEAPEAVEPTPEEAPEATEETPAPKSDEVDLTSFENVVAEVIDDRDESTGEMPSEALAKVNEVYRNLDGVKAKNRARSFLEEKMKEAINEHKDIVLARSFMTLKDGLSSTTSGGTRAPADPTLAFVTKVVSLQLAYNLVLEQVPDGVNDDWQERVDALINETSQQVEDYKAYLASDDEDAEEPEVSPAVRQAFKLVRGRSTGGGGGARLAGGPRRDVEKHLIQVFEDLEPGSFLSVNEIAKAKSTEYGDDRPSQGAVSARLFPKSRPEYNANGIKAVGSVDGKPRGAVKVG